MLEGGTATTSCNVLLFLCYGIQTYISVEKLEHFLEICYAAIRSGAELGSYHAFLYWCLPVAMETRANINNGKMSVLRLSKLPFEQLPNLPKAVIPKLELQVEPIDWTADTKAISEQRNVGRYSKDESCQTDETELGDVKEVSNVLEELTLVKILKYL